MIHQAHQDWIPDHRVRSDPWYSQGGSKIKKKIKLKKWKQGLPPFFSLYAYFSHLPSFPEDNFLKLHARIPCSLWAEEKMQRVIRLLSIYLAPMNLHGEGLYIKSESLI